VVLIIDSNLCVLVPLWRKKIAYSKKKIAQCPMMIWQVCNHYILKKLLIYMLPALIFSCSNNMHGSFPDHNNLAAVYLVEDRQWYLENIPFFECSDKKIENVYYYRWKMYKAHIRYVGDNSYVITEFINHVPWDREPFCTINAASMHHIYEGRWLKDNRYIDGYIANLYLRCGRYLCAISCKWRCYFCYKAIR